MHPRTPARLARFAETHRQVGAICNAATWLEYALEVAISELDGTFEIGHHQGRYSTELIKAAHRAIAANAAVSAENVTALADLLGRIKTELDRRDSVVHSTWLFNNNTTPGHVTGQRFRRHEVQVRDWHPDELEAIRESLELLEEELGVAAWNAVQPPNEHM